MISAPRKKHTAGAKSSNEISVILAGCRVTAAESADDGDDNETSNDDDNNDEGGIVTKRSEMCMAMQAARTIWPIQRAGIRL